jgi:hypothetical protein
MLSSMFLMVLVMLLAVRPEGWIYMHAAHMKLSAPAITTRMGLSWDTAEQSLPNSVSFSSNAGWRYILRFGSI